METIRIESKGKYAILHLERGRANPMNQTMISEIRQFFKTASDDDAIQGVIITGQPNFFTAGLDLLELYHYDKEQMAIFWNAFISMTEEMMRFPKPLIAAINGHSPAGGCIMAICADYRVMADEERFMIGLNEVPVGIVVPNGILYMYGFWIGEGRAYQSLLEGKLFTPQEALGIGLVNEVTSLENVISLAEQKMEHYLSLPRPVWIQSKRQLRKKWLENTQITETEKQATLEVWWSDAARAVMAKMVGRLKPNKKA